MGKVVIRCLSLILVLMIGLSIILGGCSADNTQKVISSAEGNFTVTLPPGYPSAEKSTQNVGSAIGNIGLTIFASENSNGCCMICFCDYPDEIIEKSNIGDLLDGARNGALANIKGTMEKEEPYSVEGNQGRKVYFSLTAGQKKGYGQAIFLVVKSRLYQMMFLSTKKENPGKPEIQEFFKSFKLAGSTQK